LNKRVFLAISVIFLILPGLQAQVSTYVPELFDLFITNYYLLNPASTDTSYTFKIASGNKSETGLFQGVNKIYLDGDLLIKKRSDKEFHFAGFQVINNREGEFINRNRFSGRYSWRNQISMKASISAGISIGLVNYSFKTSQTGTGGSDFAPDGNIGVWYLRPSFGAGFSAQQIFRSSLQPVAQEFVLNRFYNFNIYKNFVLSPSLNFKTHIFSTSDLRNRSGWSAAALAGFRDFAEAGIVYRYNRGINFTAGLQKIKIGQSEFGLWFSYLHRTGEIAVNDNALEIFLSFQK
jgi:hypothetical protein